MTNVKAIEIAREDARPWLTRSLTAGFGVSETVLVADPFGYGRFLTFVPSDLASDQIEFPERGIVPSGVADSGLARFVDDLTASGASCVVIEDDVGRRTDPKLGRMAVPSAFIEDRVVHWCDLELESGTAVAKAIREGAFGYPLNAFVVGKSSTDLLLVDGQPAAEQLASEVVESLLAVVVSAFDGQSFAVWDRG